MSKTFLKGISVKCIGSPIRSTSSPYQSIRCSFPKTLLSQPLKLKQHHIFPKIYATNAANSIMKRFIVDIPDPSEVNDILQDKDIKDAYKKRIAWEKFIPRPASYQEVKAANPEFSILRLIHNVMDVGFDYMSRLPPIQWTAEAFQVVHYEVGVPWLAMIAVCGISARVLVQPLLWISHRNRTAAFALPEYQRLLKLYRLEASSVQRREIKIRMKRLAEMSGYKKWKDWLPFMQFPIGALFLLGLRLGLLSDPSTFDAGIYFFQNLGVADPHHRLAVLYACSLFVYNLAVRAYWSWPSAILMSAVSVMAFLILGGMPQGVFVYLLLNLVSRTTWMTIRRFTMMRMRLKQFEQQKKFEAFRPLKTVKSGGVSPITSLKNNSAHKK